MWRYIPGELLFWIQIVGAAFICTSQAARIAQTTQGQLWAMFIILELSFLLQLPLAIAAHRKQPSEKTYKSIITYAVWLALLVWVNLAFVRNGSYVWSENDLWAFILAGAGAVGIYFILDLFDVTVFSPIFKSALTILFRAFPQLMVALEVGLKGGAGIPLTAIVVGNITIAMRLVQNMLLVREDPADSNRWWLFWAEVATQISWGTVTAVWVYKQYVQ